MFYLSACFPCLPTLFATWLTCLLVLLFYIYIHFPSLPIYLSYKFQIFKWFYQFRDFTCFTCWPYFSSFTSFTVYPFELFNLFACYSCLTGPPCQQPVNIMFIEIHISQQWYLKIKVEFWSRCCDMPLLNIFEYKKWRIFLVGITKWFVNVSVSNLYLFSHGLGQSVMFTRTQLSKRPFEET